MKYHINFTKTVITIFSMIPEASYKGHNLLDRSQAKAARLIKNAIVTIETCNSSYYRIDVLFRIGVTFYAAYFASCDIP